MCNLIVIFNTDAIMFGQRFENKARDMFIKTHRFKHRHCRVEVPGLLISKEDPVLACSPDGIVDCKLCGQFLIEIKCLFKHKGFHPKNALKLSICVEDENNNLTLRRSQLRYSN